MRAVRSVSTERGRMYESFRCWLSGQRSRPRLPAGPFPGNEGSYRTRQPRIFSAMGLLSAKVEHHTVATFFHQTRELSLEALNVAYARSKPKSRTCSGAKGFPNRRSELRVRRRALCGSVLRAHGAGARWSTRRRGRAAIERAFAAEHKRTYGHHGDDGEAYALTNLRVIGEVAGGREGLGARKSASVASRSGSRTAYFGAAYGWIETPVIGRAIYRRMPPMGRC